MKHQINHWRRLPGVIVLIAAILFFCQGDAKTNDMRDSLDFESKLDSYIQQVMETHEIPGLAIGIIKHAELKYAKGFGVKSIKTYEPVTTKSLFHTASVSKPFLATAIMQLAERGKLNIDDSVVRHLPYFKLNDDRYRKITLHQLLTHTSGLPDIRDYHWDQPEYDDESLERYVRNLQDVELLFDPGKRWSYSNMAFEILGDVIAKVSGQNFEAYIENNILIPLEMQSSTFLKTEAAEELCTCPHVFKLIPSTSGTYPYHRAHAPSSNLYSNVIDLAKWAIANLNRGVYREQTLLLASTYNSLWENQTDIGNNEGIGYSWFLGKHRGRQTVWHGGRDTGFCSQFVMLPEDSSAVILLCNYDCAPLDAIKDALLDLMAGYEPVSPKTPMIIPLGKCLLENDIQATIALYKELRSNRLYQYNFQEEQLNFLGYQLLGMNRTSDAVEIFKLNAETYPDAFNTYDSLGEAYMVLGNNKSAIKNYEKSLKLNPQNLNAIEKLKALRK
ncbi:serine hydrolase [candidate division KSB1 bacterium]|nr:serine hydrolase [candidate division KSB1 bacterium]